MADIYQNCVLTSAALDANSSEQRIFGRRDPSLYRLCWLFADDGGKDVCVHPTSGDNNTFSSSFEKAPLHERGWVVQVPLLSPRALNFGTSAIWECRHYTATETWPNGEPQADWSISQERPHP